MKIKENVVLIVSVFLRNTCETCAYGHVESSSLNSGLEEYGGVVCVFISEVILLDKRPQMDKYLNVENT